MLVVTSGRRLSATLDGKGVQPKVAVLFALMAVRRQRLGADAAWVSALELANFASWSASRPESIGKEVSRALKGLGSSAAGSVESPNRGKTRSWRLCPAFDRIRLRPALGSVEEALDAERILDKPIELVAWLAPAVRALTNLHSGKAIAAMENASSAFDTTASQRPIVRASVAVLLARVAMRAGYDGTDLSQSLAPANASVSSSRTSGSGDARVIDASDDILRGLLSHPLWMSLGEHHPLRARIAARLDFLLRHDPNRTIADRDGGMTANMERAYALAHQAGPLAASGDLSTAGTLLNVAGALANLSGDYKRARAWLGRAIPLLIATGALPELESAVFNLALNVDQVHRAGRLDGDERLVGELLELDELLCSAFGFDRETIQTQALLAAHAIRNGNLDAAERALDRAEEVLSDMTSKGEQGCYYERRAHLIAARIVAWSGKSGDRNTKSRSARRPGKRSGASDQSRLPELKLLLDRHLGLAIQCYEADQRLSIVGKLRKARAHVRRAGSKDALVIAAAGVCELM